MKDADVFLTNVRPAALKRARLDYDSLKEPAAAADLRRVTGYGLEGEGADLPAFDQAAYLVARRAWRARLTPQGHEPPLCRPAMGDASCALATVSATLAAVIERQGTGRGRLVETSLIRTGVYSIGWDMAIQLKWGRLAQPAHPQGGVRTRSRTTSRPRTSAGSASSRATAATTSAT